MSKGAAKGPHTHTCTKLDAVVPENFVQSLLNILSYPFWQTQRNTYRHHKNWIISRSLEAMSQFYAQRPEEIHSIVVLTTASRTHPCVLLFVYLKLYIFNWTTTKDERGVFFKLQNSIPVSCGWFSINFMRVLLSPQWTALFSNVTLLIFGI